MESLPFTWPGPEIQVSFLQEEVRDRLRKEDSPGELTSFILTCFQRKTPSKGHPEEHLEHGGGIICFFLQHLWVPCFLDWLSTLNSQEAPSLTPSGISSHRSDKWILPIFCFHLPFAIGKASLSRPGCPDERAEPAATDDVEFIVERWCLWLFLTNFYLLLIPINTPTLVLFGLCLCLSNDSELLALFSLLN